MFLKEAIFIISYVAYFLLEKKYGLGAVVVILNGILGLFIKSYIAKALSIAFLSIYIGLHTTGGYKLYELLAFFGLSILYPVFGSLGGKNTTKNVSSSSSTQQQKVTPNFTSSVKSTPIASNIRSPSNYDSSSDIITPASNDWDANERLYNGNSSSPMMMTKEGKKKVLDAAESARKRENERKQKRISELLSNQK
jgi:hypothetical protein